MNENEYRQANSAAGQAADAQDQAEAVASADAKTGTAKAGATGAKAGGPKAGAAKPSLSRKVAGGVLSVVAAALIGVSGWALAASPSGLPGGDAAVAASPDGANQDGSQEGESDASPSDEAEGDSSSGSSSGSKGSSSGNSSSHASTGNSGSSSGNSGSHSKLITVSVTVDGSAAGAGTLASGSASFQPGATVYDALCAVASGVNARGSQYGVYVAGIGGLAEKQHGATSGWTYYVNGVFANTACSNYVLKDGDVVRWVYVTG